MYIVTRIFGKIISHGGEAPVLAGWEEDKIGRSYAVL